MYQLNQTPSGKQEAEPKPPVGAMKSRNCCCAANFGSGLTLQLLLVFQNKRTPDKSYIVYITTLISYDILLASHSPQSIQSILFPISVVLFLVASENSFMPL